MESIVGLGASSMIAAPWSEITQQADQSQIRSLMPGGELLAEAISAGYTYRHVG